MYFELEAGLGGPEDDHQLHHCCWTGREGEREEEEEDLICICVTCYLVTFSFITDCTRVSVSIYYIHVPLFTAFLSYYKTVLQ